MVCAKVNKSYGKTSCICSSNCVNENAETRFSLTTTGSCSRAAAATTITSQQSASKLATAAARRPTLTQGTGRVRGVGAAGTVQSNATNGTHVVGHVTLPRHAIHVLAVALEGSAHVGIPDGGSLRRGTGDAAVAANAKPKVATGCREIDTDRTACAGDGTAGGGTLGVVVVPVPVCVVVSVPVPLSSETVVVVVVVLRRLLLWRLEDQLITLPQDNSRAL